MGMSFQQLKTGDRVYHPTYGLGVIEGTVTLDQGGQATEFYSVRLPKGGMLTVPLERAPTLGLRRIVNGLKAVVACLRTPAHVLPDNDRARVIELKASWQAARSSALTEAVRDLMSWSRTHRLTPNDKRWLTSACERLSAEAAVVDSIELIQAQTAIQQAINSLKTAPA
jgi:RNA polymerase-interacting CarD/CdnL/TRCF family regulator